MMRIGRLPDRAADPVVSPVVTGMLLGAVAGLGLLLVAARVRAHPPPDSRPARAALPARRPPAGPGSRGRPGIVARRGGDRGVRPAAPVGGRRASSGCSVALRPSARRLERAALDRTVHEFRVEQVLWGLVGFALVAAYCLLDALSGGGGTRVARCCCARSGSPPGCWCATPTSPRRSPTASAGSWRSSRCSPSCSRSPWRPARARSPHSTASYVAAAASCRATSAPSSPRCAPASPSRAPSTSSPAPPGVPSVARFAQGVAVAVERGTPLADVLHAQAADVREAGRRELIEVAAREGDLHDGAGRLPRPSGDRPHRLLARRDRPPPHDTLTPGERRQR